MWWVGGSVTHGKPNAPVSAKIKRLPYLMTATCVVSSPSNGQGVAAQVEFESKV